MKYNKHMDSEEKRLVALRYDLDMKSEQALAMEFIAFRREILEFGFKGTSAYDYMNEAEQDVYDELIK